jgi:hypothetical protein
MVSSDTRDKVLKCRACPLSNGRVTDSASNAAPPTDQPYPDPARLDATDQDQEPRDTLRPGQDARGRHRPDPQTDSTEWWLRGAVARDPEPSRRQADPPGYPDPTASARLYEQLYDEAPTQYSAAVLLGDTAGFPVVPPPHPAPLEPREAAQSPAPRAPEPPATEPPATEPPATEPPATESPATEPLTFAREPWAPVLPPPVPFAPSGPVADDTEPGGRRQVAG